MRIKDVSITVEEILTSIPETRNDDQLLYFETCKKYNPDIASMSFRSVITNLDMLGLPSEGSVTRSRRKLQELHKELRATKETTNARYEKFKEVLEYVGELQAD